MKQRKEKQWEKLMKPKTGSLKGSIKLIKKQTNKQKKPARQTTKEKLSGKEETSFQILQKLKS